MSNIKAVIIRKDSSGAMTNRIMTTPKRVIVRQEGLRASDNMDMWLSAEHAVEQGDEIYYIQDVLDTSSLKAIWNFYGGFRDESGYEHDDVYAGDFHTMSSCVDSTLQVTEAHMDWKHKGYYKFKIQAHSNSSGTDSGLNGIQIKKKFKNNNVDSNGDPVASSIPVIDMSGEFDMIFEFKTTHNRDGQTLFDNYDHATSSGKGLKIVINSSSNNITITTDDGTTETVMVASSITTYNTVTFVRIRRQAGVFKLYLGGVEKTLTYSANTGNFNSTQDIHFFKEYNESTSPAAYITNTGWNGVPIQFRFYNTALPDDEVKKLQVAKPVNTTMKFGGKIWKLGNSGSSKKLVCSSHAKDLLGTQISSKIYGNAVGNATTTATIGSGARVSNRYYATGSGTGDRPKMDEIITDILKYVDDGVYVYFAEEPSTSFQGDFIAEGSFLDILKLMMIIDRNDHIFVVTARKILFISDEPITDQVINSDNYNIIDSGKDDTGTTNSIFVSGRSKNYSWSNTYTNLAISQNTWSVIKPITTRDGFIPAVRRINKVTRDGTEIFADNNATMIITSTPSTDTFRLFEDNTIQFWNDSDGNAHTYIVTFEYAYAYDPSGNYSLASSTTQFKQDTTANIKTNGLYHRNISVPQLVSGFDIAYFATSYIDEFKTINTRYEAKTPMLVNSLTVGQKVRYTDSTGTTDRVVRSIEYSYPQTTTVIELGEYLFSGFDVEKQTIDSLRGLDTSTSVSRY